MFSCMIPTVSSICAWIFWICQLAITAPRRPLHKLMKKFASSMCQRTLALVHTGYYGHCQTLQV